MLGVRRQWAHHQILKPVVGEHQLHEVWNGICRTSHLRQHSPFKNTFHRVRILYEANKSSGITFQVSGNACYSVAVEDEGLQSRQLWEAFQNDDIVV